LAGAWNGAQGLMRTDLNAAEIIPLDQPYEAVAPKSVAADYFSVNTNIVDWVWLELRTGTAASTSVFKEAFLLGNDGWLINPSGSSDLGLNGIADGDYYVVIGHRNHLSIMSNALHSLNGSDLLSVDFTSDMASMHSINADPAEELAPGVFGMWSGDATGNGEVKYTASGNDRVEILNVAGGPTPFDTASGYFIEDINLDGLVKYAGSNNDRVEVLGTSGGPSAFDSRKDQVPD